MDIDNTTTPHETWGIREPDTSTVDEHRRYEKAQTCILQFLWNPAPVSSKHDFQHTHSLESHWISCFNLPTSIQVAAACRGSVAIALLAVDKFVVLSVFTGAVNCSPGKTSFLDGGGSWQMWWACFFAILKDPVEFYTILHMNKQKWYHLNESYNRNSNQNEYPNKTLCLVRRC